MGSKKTPGRPEIGPAIKFALPHTDLTDLDDVVDQMNTHPRRAPSNFTPGEETVWKRAHILRRLIRAGLGQWRTGVLGEQHAVKNGAPCPLCFGYVDGPHHPRCGYFGPRAGADPDFVNRLRTVLARDDTLVWSIDVKGADPRTR